MNIDEKYGNDTDRITKAIRDRETQLQWYADHPWEWEGSFKRTAEFRRLHHNTESLRARLEKLETESSADKSK